MDNDGDPYLVIDTPIRLPAMYQVIRGQADLQAIDMIMVVCS